MPPRETSRPAPLHVVTAADGGFVEGLLVTLASCLLWLREDQKVHLHILDGGIEPAKREEIRLCLARFHPSATVHFHPLKQADFSGFNPGPGNSRMYYARFRMASMVPADLVVYLDADTVVLEDLNELVSFWRSEDTLLAAQDRKVRRLEEDCPWPLGTDERHGPYFNSGVLVTSLEKWRVSDVEERALRLARDAGKNCRWYDQTVLNYVFRRDFREIADVWNWQRESVPAEAKILHFTAGRKPWRTFGPDARFRIWREVLAACGRKPAAVLLKNAGPAGLLHGLLERTIRCSAAGRRFVLPLLLSCDRKNTEGNRIYYTSGPGGPGEQEQVSPRHPLLSKLRKKL